MRGKKWVLEPHAIEVKGNAAQVNLFRVDGGYAAPVTFGGKADAVTVKIRNLPGVTMAARLHVAALYPGQQLEEPISVVRNGQLLEMNVPLKRGCAMLRIRQIGGHGGFD
jgi:hypothetical protein